MLSLFFNFVLNLLGTLIQIVLLPINTLITNAFPNISNSIITATNGILPIFDNMTWAINFIPDSTRIIILAIIGFEVSYHSIYLVATNFSRVWEVIQRLKFW